MKLSKMARAPASAAFPDGKCRPAIADTKQRACWDTEHVGSRPRRDREVYSIVMAEPRRERVDEVEDHLEALLLEAERRDLRDCGRLDAVHPRAGTVLNVNMPPDPERRHPGLMAGMLELGARDRSRLRVHSLAFKTSTRSSRSIRRRATSAEISADAANTSIARDRSRDEITVGTRMGPCASADAYAAQREKSTSRQQSLGRGPAISTDSDCPRTGASASWELGPRYMSARGARILMPRPHLKW